jgi:hypothetical protein
MSQKINQIAQICQHLHIICDSLHNCFLHKNETIISFHNSNRTAVLVLLCRIHDDGLKHILLHYGTQRSDVYRRIFGILWFGNGLGKSSITTATPIYIFPADLVAVI